jgi:outer membrane lipoprotein carrier protein
MKLPIQSLIAGLLLVVCPWASASSLDSLDQFLHGTQGVRAEFSQVVTAPARDGQAGRSKTSSGVFEFSRPGRFRFLYKKPFEQTIVADGQTLWLYDADLQQVSARNQAQALGTTPAALIAGGADLRLLQADFALEAAPDQDGLQWVKATPKAKETQLQTVRIGLRMVAGRAELASLEIVDSFGQHSVLSFSKTQVNPRFAADTFSFKAPPGVSVIRQ